MNHRSLTRRRLGAALATALAVGVTGCATNRDQETAPGDGDHDPIEDVPGESTATDTEAGIPSPPGNETADETTTRDETDDGAATGTQVGNETATADATAIGSDIDENTTADATATGSDADENATT